MKSLATPFLLFFISASYGQATIINRSLTDSSLNIIYTNIENEIKIKTNRNVQYDQVIVAGVRSRIAKIAKDEYLLRVSSTDPCTLSLRYRGKTIFSKQFKTDTIPQPEATIIGIRNSDIGINQLLLNPYITVIVPNCYYDLGYLVLSFHAIFIQGNDSLPTSAQSNRFSVEQIQIMRDLNVGDKIYFDRLLTTCKSCRLVTLSPFWIRIK